MSPLLLALTVSLAAPDAAFDEPDAGVLSRAGIPADVAWVGDGFVKAVWVTPARDLAFQMDRRRARDLWVNELFPDGGLLRAQGAILCPAQPLEFFSSPRVAGNRLQTLVAWKVSLPDRDVIRVTEVTANGATTCSRTVHDPGANARLGDLQLEESGGTFLLLWETASHFVTMPVGTAGVGSANALVDKNAMGLSGVIEPSLAPRVGGFYIAWRQGTVFKGLELTALGVGPGSPASPFTSTLASNPVVAGPVVRAVFVANSGNGTSSLVVGNPQLGLFPVTGPSDAEAPLLATVEGTSTVDATLVRTRAFFQSGSDWWMTDFVLQSRTQLPTPLEPLATSGAFNRTALLAQQGPERTFVVLSGAVTGTEDFVGPVTRTAESQLLASVAWVDTGLFAVSYMEGTTHVGGALDPAAADRLSMLTRFSVDGGVSRFHPRPDASGVAVSTWSNTGSTLSLTQGPSSSQPILWTTASGLDEAVVGEKVSVFWERGTGRYVWGEGTRGLFQPVPGQVLGRCGAKIDEWLLVPIAEDEQLRLLALKDEVVASPVFFTLSVDARGLESPCLAASGRSILVVANDGTGALRAWSATLDDVLLGTEAESVGSLPSRPNGRGAKNPVVVGTAAGWVLAWESTDAFGNSIAKLELAFDGRVLSSGQVSNGLDDRVPLLAASPAGDVVVVWHQFVDAEGAVLVRTKRLVQAPAIDAGTPDAGAPDAGPVEPDAGLPDAGTPDGGTRDAGVADGGVDPQQYQFTACGCGPSGDPALVFFGVFLFAARRKLRASPRA
jgi:hypothetical protein